MGEVCPTCDHEDDPETDSWVLGQVAGMGLIDRAVGRDLGWLQALAESTGDERIAGIIKGIETSRRVPA